MKQDLISLTWWTVYTTNIATIEILLLAGWILDGSPENVIAQWIAIILFSLCVTGGIIMVRGAYDRAYYKYTKALKGRNTWEV